MHTSTRLTAADFTFWHLHHDQRSPIPFTEFCPDYHELDRIGVVSPDLSDGVLHTGRSLLALTTAFYDCHRARGGEFFDYPQHFAFVGSDSLGLLSNEPEPWQAWSWLDVWPNNKWVSAPVSAGGMLQTVFDYQINRLFWPQTLWPMPNEDPLPEYAYKMLKTRLKTVYLYNPSGQEESSPKPMMEVATLPAAAALLQESIECLPALEKGEEREAVSTVECMQPISVADFLLRMQRPTLSSQQVAVG